VQLNCYPQIGAITPNSTQGTTFPGEVVGQLEWFQYVLNVTNNSASFEIQYWAHAKSYQDAGPGGNPPEIRWPPGYTPNPLNTSPWLPVFPGTAVTGSVGSVSSNRIPAGSVITIALATDSSGNVTGATFSIADPNGNVQSGSTQPWSDYAGQAEPANYALFPIYGFQLDLVSAPGLPVMFMSGAGTLTYSVSSGALPNHQHMRWYPTRHSRKLQHRLPGRHASVRLYGQPVLRRSRDEHEFLFRQVDLWPG
jgi:hypothetical protein